MFLRITAERLCKNKTKKNTKNYNAKRNYKDVVFYNGDPEQPARLELKLSDSYVHREENPGLELIVTQININPGYNDEFLDTCPVLKDYMLYTDRVRTYSRKKMSLTQAVDRAVDECISEEEARNYMNNN